MRIAYIWLNSKHYDPSNKSSVAYYFVYYLKKYNCEVLEFSPRSPFLEFLFKVKKAYIQLIKKKNYFYHREPRLLKSYARQTEKFLENSGVDFCFNFGCLPLAFLPENVNKAFWSDATFANIIDYNYPFKNYDKASRQVSDNVEEQVLNDCDFSFFSSKWASEKAINHYKVDKKKVVELPLGANWEHEPDKKLVLKSIENRDAEKINILFVGRLWEEKGGEKALEVVKLINKLGKKCKLHIVGVSPEISKQDSEYVEIHGFLQKENQKDLDKLNELYATSHFFFMMSRAECFGHVYCEASAYGLPSLASNTGGVASAVINNRNGLLFESDANPEKIAEKISGLINDSEKYKILCQNSLDDYHSRLSYNITFPKIIKLLEEHLAKKY